jgi:CheY-like chemotaxis protein
MDGFRLTEQIRANGHIPKAIILMLTSGGHPGDFARCRELDISSYLMKPITQSTLLDAIVTTLRLSGFSIQKPAPLQPTSPIQERSLKILLAEDNPVNQRVTVRLLEKHGHSVHVVLNGKLALEALAKQFFDLVLMDVQMPEMDGFEATAAIRAREKIITGAHIPIIAMTAHAMKGDKDRCLEAGMDAYLSKPVQAESLFKVLDEVMNLISKPAAIPPRPSTVSKVKDAHFASGSPAPAGGVSAILDLRKALARIDNDLGLFQELVEIFVDDYPRLLAEIREALAQKDAWRLKVAAHTLKGAVANFEANAAFEAAKKLEKIGTEGNLEGAEEVFSELEQALERLHPALEKILLKTIVNANPSA